MLVEECAGCGIEGTALCASCIAALVPDGRLVPPPTGMDACVALCRYDAAARRVIGSLKYRNHPGVARVLGTALAVLLVGELRAGAVCAPPPITTVTWVPTSATRRRRRGYDQARLLAAAVATESGWGLAGLLARGRGPAQVIGLVVARTCLALKDPPWRTEN